MLQRIKQYLNDNDHVLLYVSMICFFSMCSFTVSLPFYQDRYDELECGDLCRGTLTSVRSGITLFSASFIGRLSDHPKIGRRAMLYVGLFSKFFSLIAVFKLTSMLGVWIQTVIPSLFDQTIGVSKAIIADHSIKNERMAKGNVVQSTKEMGRLGMILGVAFMIGPAIGATLSSNYEGSIKLAFVCLILASICLFKLPETSREANRPTTTQGKSLHDLFQNLGSFLTSMPSDEKGGVALIVTMRLFMGLAYHIFAIMWSGALKHKFNLGPRGQALYMGWMGLSYALSQGFIVAPLLKAMRGNNTNLVLLCMSVLAIGRWGAILAPNVVIVFVMAGLGMVSLGVLNSVINNSCSHLAKDDAAGGLFGLVTTTENFAGLIGPTLGGFLSQISEYTPMYAVTFLYSSLIILCLFFFEEHINSRIKAKRE